MKDNGGPAFPAEEIIVRSKIIDASQGMTLRDYFAAEAMKGCPVNQYLHAGVAEFCYQRADAMLKERKK